MAEARRWRQFLGASALSEAKVMRSTLRSCASKVLATGEEVPQAAAEQGLAERFCAEAQTALCIRGIRSSRDSLPTLHSVPTDLRLQ